jgi:hypothetical protein
LALIGPIFLSVLVMTMLPGQWPVLIPFSMIAVATFFLPFGNGNPSVARLVRSLPDAPDAKSGPPSFITQVTVTPRLRTGLRAVVEDADDVGWLTIGDDGLSFQGDSIRLFLPWENIRKVRPHDLGLRGIFVHARSIAVVVCGMPKVESLQFGERSALALPASRRIIKEMYRQLVEKVDRTRSRADQR